MGADEVGANFFWGEGVDFLEGFFVGAHLPLVGGDEFHFHGDVVGFVVVNFDAF